MKAILTWAGCWIASSLSSHVLQESMASDSTDVTRFERVFMAQVSFISSAEVYVSYFILGLLYEHCRFTSRPHAKMHKAPNLPHTHQIVLDYSFPVMSKNIQKLLNSLYVRYDTFFSPRILFKFLFVCVLVLGRPTAWTA